MTLSKRNVLQIFEIIVFTLFVVSTMSALSYAIGVNKQPSATAPSDVFARLFSDVTWMLFSLSAVIIAVKIANFLTNNKLIFMETLFLSLSVITCIVLIIVLKNGLGVYSSLDTGDMLNYTQFVSGAITSAGLLAALLCVTIYNLNCTKKETENA